MTNLELLRRKKGLSQQELADHLGIPRADVSRMENEWTRRVKPEVEEKLQEIFGAQWDFAALMNEPEPTLQAAK